MAIQFVPNNQQRQQATSESLCRGATLDQSPCINDDGFLMTISLRVDAIPGDLSAFAQ